MLIPYLYYAELKEIRDSALAGIERFLCYRM